MPEKRGDQSDTLLPERKRQSEVQTVIIEILLIPIVGYAWFEAMSICLSLMRSPKFLRLYY